MTEDEQPDRVSGSVPHAYGNAIAWRWAREMPASLKRGGLLTLLYALRSMASANGELRFQGDRKPIRIQDIAKAAGCDEKDGRDRIDAAILAGVVVVKGERKRGVQTLYALLVAPQPDWYAAVAFLAEVKRRREEAKQKRGNRKPPPWSKTDEFGGRSPELSAEEFGGPAPELTASTTGGAEDEVRGTAPRWSSGDRPPLSSGGGPPNNPGSTHGFPTRGADDGSQPQVDTGWDHLQEPPPDDEPDDYVPDPSGAIDGGGPALRALEGGGRNPGGQSPLLLPVHDTAQAPAPDHRLIAAELTALYGAHVAVRQAAVTALAVLGELSDQQRPADPTAWVLAAVRRDPGRYRPTHLPPAGRAERAASDS